jgi:putative flavoprotein involved in K+ transport
MGKHDAFETHQAVIVGGGQAGLAMGHALAGAGVDFVILDANAHVGDAWRNRWDSLRLFTPAAHDGLPGLPFPAAKAEFPTKDQMADYLEAYAKRFGLPVRLGVAVDRLTRDGNRYLVTAGDRRFQAAQVVVATGAYQRPVIPSFASQLDPSIVQLHSAAYRNPSQLPDGDVLVVGAGNSGAEIALEVAAAGHRTWLSGRSTGHVPRAVHVANDRLLWWVAEHVLTLDTPIGRKLRPRALSHGAPLIRVKPRHLTAAGVRRVPCATGIEAGRPALADAASGQVPDIRAVIWATGFGLEFGWIRLPIFDQHGAPRHDRGVVRSEPGLCFVGLHFLSGFTSALIGGVGTDAERIARRVATNLRVGNPRQEAEAHSAF